MATILEGQLDDNGREPQPAQGESRYTIFFVYGTGADRWSEEVDANARTEAEAREAALEYAARDLCSGWTEVHVERRTGMYF